MEILSRLLLKPKNPCGFSPWECQFKDESYGPDYFGVGTSDFFTSTVQSSLKKSEINTLYTFPAGVFVHSAPNSSCHSEAGSDKCYRRFIRLVNELTEPSGIDSFKMI